MTRYILTGAPGAGKTTLLRALEARGFRAIEEAATDVCLQALAAGEAEPWRAPGFVERIFELQLQRLEAAGEDGIQLHDRAPACTLALARFIGRPVPAVLEAEVRRLAAEEVYSRRVFFVRNLGVCERTAVRRIGFEDCLRFEALHEEVYRGLGYDLVEVPALPAAGRADLVAAAITAAGRSADMC